MADVIMLNDGRTETVFNSYQFIRLVEAEMGFGPAEYLQDVVDDFNEEINDLREEIDRLEEAI